ncbi:MAG: phosphate uptake regulator PhoU [Fervidicoccaceae archaeon]
MYRRKVQMVGGSTYVVSIPKQWAEEMGIEEGSDVGIEKLADGSLKIFPVSGKRPEPPAPKLYFSCIESDEVMSRAILAHYLGGAKEIKIIAKDVECKERILKVISFLKSKVLGLEVIEETSSEVTLGVILDFKFSNLSSAQQKMLKTICSMVDDIVRAVSESNPGILSDIYKRDDLLDRLYLYSIRYITAIASSSETEDRIMPHLLPHYALIMKSLERIGDHVSAIAKNLVESLNRNEIEKHHLEQLISFLTQTKALLDQISLLAQKFDYSLLVKATELAISLLRKEAELRRSIDKPMIYYSYIVESCRRIAAYSIDVLESILDVAALIRKDLGSIQNEVK